MAGRAKSTRLYLRIGLCAGPIASRRQPQALEPGRRRSCKTAPLKSTRVASGPGRAPCMLPARLRFCVMASKRGTIARRTLGEPGVSSTKLSAFARVSPPRRRALPPAGPQATESQILAGGRLGARKGSGQAWPSAHPLIRSGPPIGQPRSPACGLPLAPRALSSGFRARLPAGAAPVTSKSPKRAPSIQNVDSQGRALARRRGSRGGFHLPLKEMPTLQTCAKARLRAQSGFGLLQRARHERPTRSRGDRRDAAFVARPTSHGRAGAARTITQAAGKNKPFPSRERTINRQAAECSSLSRAKFSRRNSGMSLNRCTSRRRLRESNNPRQIFRSAARKITLSEAASLADTCKSPASCADRNFTADRRTRKGSCLQRR
jgi:hypothetical protein